MRYVFAGVFALTALAAIPWPEAKAQIVDQECRVVVICDETGRCPHYVVCEPITD